VSPREDAQNTVWTMKHRRHDRSPDHLDAALEASCGALITLEAILASAARVPPDVVIIQAQALRAIDSLRAVIADLRRLRDEDLDSLLVGFVCPGAEHPQNSSRDY
jgi:hypothetical protein